MLTATARPPTDAARFALRCGVASLAVFGLVRLPWTETNLLLPLTGLQASLAITMFGTPSAPVDATLACSGADALALCLGAVAAYPVSRRARLAGAAGGVALILALNILRIGTLGQVAAVPAWFSALHLYVWPALLTLAIAGYVFAWMHYTDATQTVHGSAVAPRPFWQTARPHPSMRFVLLTAFFVVAFAAASSLIGESPVVLAAAAAVARAAAAILGALGVTAHAAANVLWTPRGGFTVTRECLATPLIPVYLAATFATRQPPRRLALALLAAIPLFVALAVVRLLMVTLPDLFGAPLFLVHAFYQLLLGAVIVAGAAWWRHRGSAAIGYAVLGMLAGVLFVAVLGPPYARLVAYCGGAPSADPQGAIAFLPSYQVGLYLALAIAAFLGTGWPRLLAGLAGLGLTQAVGMFALNLAVGYAGITPHVREVRGWAVAGPVLILAAVVNLARQRRSAS